METLTFNFGFHHCECEKVIHAPASLPPPQDPNLYLYPSILIKHHWTRIGLLNHNELRELHKLQKKRSTLPEEATKSATATARETTREPIATGSDGD